MLFPIKRIKYVKKSYLNFLSQSNDRARIGQITVYCGGKYHPPHRKIPRNRYFQTLSSALNNW